MIDLYVDSKTRQNYYCIIIEIGTQLHSNIIEHNNNYVLLNNIIPVGMIYMKDNICRHDNIIFTRFL